VAFFCLGEGGERFAEPRARLEQIVRLAGDNFPKERARASVFLGAFTTEQGDFAAARFYLEQSHSLYRQLDDQWGVAAALNALAIAACHRGDYSSAQKNFERSLAGWRALSDRLATARCLHSLANVIRVQGDYPAAHQALREATAIFDELGDSNGAAWSINQQGDIAREQGSLDEARKHYECGLSEFRQSGDKWGIGRSLADLGYVHCELGNYEAAQDAYQEALKIFAGLGHRRGLARCLEGCACLALARGHSLRALKLAAAGAHLRDLVGAPLPPTEKLKLDRTLLGAWKSLNEAEGKKAWAEGSTMSVESAIEYSLDSRQFLH
jgi:tetratricopeptide (TPR) repeat protein